MQKQDEITLFLKIIVFAIFNNKEELLISVHLIMSLLLKINFKTCIPLMVVSNISLKIFL